MKRVVITGVGVASPIGNDIATYFKNLCELNSGIKAIDTFSSPAYKQKIGACVKDIHKYVDASTRILPKPIQFLVHATEDSLKMSGISDSIESTRMGAYFAGPACSVFELENYFRDYFKKGYDAANAHDLLYCNWDSAVNVIGRKFSLNGPRNTILAACSSSGIAIGLAFDLIRLGLVDGMLAGGTDSYSEFTFSGFNALQNISPVPCKPFDKNRSGLSFGEGAGVLVLEEYEHAKKRNANIICEISGYGGVGEGYNLTAPTPDGYGYISTMQKAMKIGKVNPDDITYVNSHGTGTNINDLVEGKAIKTIFSNRDILVNSIKGLIGHCLGAAGAIEAISCVLSLQHNVIPGTKNFVEIDPEIPLDVLKETANAKVQYVLCNSAGFGGNNSSVLFKKVA